MTDDDELQQRLRRLSARPEKDERFWNAMADDVRAAYRRQSAARRRRWLAAPLVGALALAAALSFYVRAHRHHPMVLPMNIEMGLFDDDDPSELIEELDSAELDRLQQAFHRKGA